MTPFLLLDVAIFVVVQLNTSETALLTVHNGVNENLEFILKQSYANLVQVLGYFFNLIVFTKPYYILG